jgi:hypothetical protein
MEDSKCELAVPRPRRDGTFEGPATLRVDGLAVTQPVRFPVYPDLDSLLGDAIAEPGASVELRTDELADLLAVLRIRPAGSAEHLNPPAFLTVGEGKISTPWRVDAPPGMDENGGVARDVGFSVVP